MKQTSQIVLATLLGAQAIKLQHIKTSYNPVTQSLAQSLFPQVDGIIDSVEGIGGNAPCLTSFQLHTGYMMGEDLHPTHGIETKDGGIVATGNDMLASHGFVVKFKSLKECVPKAGQTKDGMSSANPYRMVDGMAETSQGCNQMAWQTKLYRQGKMDRFWQTYESPDGKFLMSVGQQEANVEANSTSKHGYAQMAIVKLDAATGKILWTMNYGGPSKVKNTQASLETASFDSEGNFIVGGLVDITGDLVTNPLYAKSINNSMYGAAFIGKISAFDLASDTAPSKFDWTWQNDKASVDSGISGSFVNVVIDSSDNIIANSKNDVAGTIVMMFSSTGEKLFETKVGNATKDDGTAIVLAADGLVLTGHNPRNVPVSGTEGAKTYDAYLTKIDQQGNTVWEKSYPTQPGGLNQWGVGTRWNAGPKYESNIFNECWGLAPRYEDDLTTLAGYVLSCGTGQEGFQGVPGSPEEEEFQSYLQSMSGNKIWRALTIATDLEGNRVWSRIDSMQTAREQSEGGGQEAGSSAGEWVIALKDGGHAIISDEQGGIGVATIAQWNKNTVACPANDTSGGAPVPVEL